jgi:hypothetical protein
MKEGKRHNLDVHPNLLFFTIITHIWRDFSDMVQETTKRW